MQQKKNGNGQKESIWRKLIFIFLILFSGYGIYRGTLDMNPALIVVYALVFIASVAVIVRSLVLGRQNSKKQNLKQNNRKKPAKQTVSNVHKINKARKKAHKAKKGKN